MTRETALAGAHASGVFASVDLHFASLLVRRGALGDPLAVTAAALAAKAVRLEHVCAVLDDEGVAVLWRHDDDGTPAPDAPSAEALVSALRAATEIVEIADEGADVDDHGDRPLVLSGPRCYLRRYALLEQLVATRLRTAHARSAPDGATSAIETLGAAADPQQRDAVARALAAPVSVVAGGPGTGKTTAVALLLGVASSLDPPLRVALAAPTGKAAARLDAAVRASGPAASGVDLPSATTLHRLLGIGRDGISRSRRPLDYDVVVVDEASMVSLPLLAETLRRTRADARVVLVGDPDQLASIEVGAVLADVVEAAIGSTSGLVISTLETPHRFADAEGVAALARAVRSGSIVAVDDAVARHGALDRLEPASDREAVLARVVAQATALLEVARAGDAAEALELLGTRGVLCAHRRGDGSTAWWTRAVERRLVAIGALRVRDLDYVGRPLLVTRNDALTGLQNGMTGVVVARDGEPWVAFETGTFPVSAVAWAETAWALTIHKSQGSEFGDVVVSLPEPSSQLLTRELVYTAVTRARRGVTVLAPPGSLEAALSRRVARASGLVTRLAPHRAGAGSGPRGGQAARASSSIPPAT